MLITSIEPLHHFMHQIINSRHTNSIIPKRNFTILRWNIGPTPIISVTIVTLIEVVVAVVIDISYIMTLTIIITIVLTLVSLTLAPILLIGALGVRSGTPRLIIHFIGVILIVIFVIWWWWFRQVIHCVYLYHTPTTCFNTNPSSVLI